MGFENDSRLQLSVRATWGGPQPPQIRSSVGVQTGGLSLEVEYDPTPPNEKKKPHTIIGLNETGNTCIIAPEGGKFRFLDVATTPKEELPAECKK
jgi:hypothetical protein